MDKCTLTNSWSIFATSDVNSFNPCFIYKLVLVISFIFYLWGVFDLYRIWKSEKYGSIAPKNTGLLHWVRIICIFIEGMLLLSTLNKFNKDEVVKSFAFQSLTWLIFIVILPLHSFETSSRTTALPSILTFWPITISLFSIILYQSYTSLPILLNISRWRIYLLIFNASFVLTLETFYWTPTYKLIYELKVSGRLKELNKPNLYSQLTFEWMNPLVEKAYVNRTLTGDDLPEIQESFIASSAIPTLSKYWDTSTKKSPSIALCKALAFAFGPMIALGCMIGIVSSLLSFIQPQLLRQIILFFDDAAGATEVSYLKGFTICLAIFIISLAITFINNLYNISNYNAILCCRSSLSGLIFQKALKLSGESRVKYPTGDIVTLVSVDVNKIQTLISNLQTLVTSPIELVVCLVSLWALIGKSTLAAIIAVVCLSPLNSLVVKLSKRLRKAQMKFTDIRSSTINEILSSIKSIKLYAWEEPMKRKLQSIRNDQELANLRKIRFVSVLSTFIWRTMPFMISFVTFATFSLTEDRPLTVDIVFPALSLLGMLSGPLLDLPAAITSIADASVSVKRIANFLIAAEVDPNQVKWLKKSYQGDPAIKIHNTTFLFAPFEAENKEEVIASPQYALKNINLTIEKGHLNCIVGRVGSGKSSLLSAILGKLYVLNDSSIEVRGSIAYCSQNPWVMNSTFKENILFGHQYDEEFYKKTIEACQLLQDIEVLPDGDNTFVGEKGITLSGGQKARLAFARAVYSRADIYLLDDILSAVDAHVAKSIIHKVLSRSTGILSKKTVILATNSLMVLPYSNHIYMLEAGNIVDDGTYSEIKNTESKISDLINDYSTVESLTISSDNEAELSDVISFEEAQLTSFQWKSLSDFTNSRTKQEVESQKKGGVKWKVYGEYIKASSVPGFIFWLFLMITSSIASVGANYWLKHWAETNGKLGVNHSSLKYIGIYAFLGFGSTGLATLRNILLWTVLGIRASKYIHARMINTILRAPMLFFDRTPIGRVMNRFTSDISKVDDSLGGLITALTARLLTTILTIVVISSVLPMYVFVVALLSVIYMYYQRYFTAISRELKRLVSVSRSPVFAHLQESLNGVDTVKAFKQVDRFKFLNEANLNFNLRSVFLMRLSNCWLRSRLSFIGAVALFAASTLSIASFFTSHPLSAGTAGFLLTYALQVRNSLSAIVNLSASVESNIVAFERCLEYTELAEEEPPKDYPKLPENFPEKGEIEFVNYSTRYAPNLDLILKNISFKINAGEKIGVVGRTGAGKSSLTLALFRIIEAAKGQIYIDGIDISTISVYDLRQHLSIIPQESQAFSGTVRQNLDPLGRHEDEELWRVLSLAHLKDHILSLTNEDQLSVKLAEGGSNFSTGQLQLMCLARALLNPSKIVVFDEATAAVDVETDRIIQSTIKENFKDRTIITIAHRLDTVMNSDRILTLNRGEIQELDTPKRLLENVNSVFYSLCKQGGYLEKS